MLRDIYSMTLSLVDAVPYNVVFAGSGAQYSPEEFSAAWTSLVECRPPTSSLTFVTDAATSSSSRKRKADEGEPVVFGAQPGAVAKTASKKPYPHVILEVLNVSCFCTFLSWNVFIFSCLN